jgi:glycosyltransferase involved in cell wall biosynthesis
MAMRILHILNDVTDRGNGIVNTAVDLAIEQARQGQTVAVASGGGGYEALLRNAGVIHLKLDQSRNPLQLLRALLRLRSILVLFRPEVVHAHMRTGLLLAWLLRPFERFALVGHVHNVHDRESILMALADRVIAVSQSVAGTMRRQGIPARKIRVVLNRTLGNRRQCDLANVEAAAIARPSIVTVAGMTARKGIEELIDAFEIAGCSFPDAHLYIVGDGPERGRFEEHARRSPFSARIHFEGFQPQPQAYMLSADIFVLASRRESFGLVLLEAREAGCAIVATDVDGIAEALDDGRAGVLVPAQNFGALAAAFCRLLGSSQERRVWQGRARQGIGNYSVGQMAREVQAIYQELTPNSAWREAGKMIWIK